jgi:hypothetical protein
MFLNDIIDPKYSLDLLFSLEIRSKISLIILGHNYGKSC